LAVIRAFGQQERFTHNMQASIDKLNVSHDAKQVNPLMFVESILPDGAASSQTLVQKPHS
jgi:hypothetical protein